MDLSIIKDFDTELLFGLTICIYLLALLNILRIIKQDLSPGATMSWILVNAIFPLLGVPLYYFLGQSKLSGYVKRRFRTHKVIGENIIQQHFQPVSIPNDHLPTIKALTSLDESFKVLPGNVTLMINGERAFPEIFKEIDRAQKYILVQYYILRQDRLGLELKEKLKAKANDGIKVCLLIDDFGSYGLGRKYVRDLKKSGIQVARFLPFGVRFNFQINFRNHRKLVLIDGEVAFTGGLNMGMEYLGQRDQGDWRDTHLKISGPCLGPLITTFLEDWYFARKKDLREEIHFHYPVKSDQHTQLIQVVSFGPGDDHISAGLVLFSQAIMSAKISVSIATPYLIPDAILEHALILASLRGVKIRILIPRVSDSKIVHMVSLVHAQKLLKYMEIYLYNDGFMHQKVILIDDKTSIIGTSNFDNRSIYLNFESSITIHDRDFSKEVSRMLENDFSKASPLILKTKQFYQFIRILGPLF